MSFLRFARWTLRPLSTGKSCNARQLHQFLRTQANATKPLRAPPGYYGPRLAVGALATVGAVALYELLSRYLQYLGQPLSEQQDWDEEWDVQPDPNDLEASSPLRAALMAAERLRAESNTQVTSRHIILVRHAQESKSQAADQSSAALSETGAKQAELTGHSLHQLFGTADIVYHSGAPEAQATASAIKKYTSGKLAESALLAEGIPRIPSPAPAALDSVQEDDLALDSARAEGAFHALMWRPRGDNAVKQSVEVVVGHGNMIRYLVCRVLQLDSAAWSRLAAYHCTVTWLEIDCDAKVTLRQFGGVGHLPKELLTYG